MSKLKSDGAKAPSDINVKDVLSSTIADNLGKIFNKELGNVIWTLDKLEDSPTHVVDWVSTGDDILDLAISNRKHGGLPVGRIVEITGLEGTGKSLLAAHLIASTQRKGGVGVFIDTEAAVDPVFFRSIGIDTAKMMYVELQTIEDIFEALESIIVSAREKSKDTIVTIVIDSIAGATTKIEAEADYGKDGYATTKAILMSKAMRKINSLIASQNILVVFTNQLRQKIDAMAFGEKWTTSGGKALDFHSSVKLRLTSMAKIKQTIHGQDEIIGVKLKAKVTKNRVGPPYRESNFELYFDSGISRYSSWIKIMKDYNIIKGAGAWNTYKFDDGKGGELEEIKFQAKDLPELLDTRPEVKESMYSEIAEKRIMLYKNQDEVVRIVGEDDIKLEISSD